jgi:hypothetical protein
MASTIALHEGAHIVVARRVRLAGEHEIVLATVAADGPRTRTRYRRPGTRSETILACGREAMIAGAALSIDDDETACEPDRANVAKHCETIVRTMTRLPADDPLNDALTMVVAILAAGFSAKAARIVQEESATIATLAAALDQRETLTAEEIEAVLADQPVGL